MVEFLLNNQLIRTDLPPGMTLLDFIRDEKELKGTKIGCREGDCGACTVIEGELLDGKVFYKTIVSCLTPLGNVQGKHIVTIEGLNGDALNPVQQAIVDHAGTQCGFCTPGFVVSLMAHCLSEDVSDYEKTMASIDGNICRCTGYKSIEKAAMDIHELLQARKNEDPVAWMIKNGWIPSWFSTIAASLADIKKPEIVESGNRIIIGGGTDLMVQKPEEIMDSQPDFIVSKPRFKELVIDGDQWILGAEVTTAEIMHSQKINEHFPTIQRHFKLIASSPIRNMGTLAGNIVNASPIADLTIFFLALDAIVNIENRERKQREIPLKEFFTGYKKLKMKPGEYIAKVRFALPAESDLFNFEKVSKREHLDIATVNSALLLRLKDDKIEKIDISAGGVAPIPLHLSKTCDFLRGKVPTTETVHSAMRIMQEEISPISDIRGSKEYKRLLLRQLFLAHFMEIFPGKYDMLSLLKSAPLHEEH
jgi:xanthine dehydrogenase small subunit